MNFIPFTGPVISISPLSSWTSDHASFIFRCQNCSLVTPGQPLSHDVTMTGFLSHVLPNYPSQSALNATLPLTNLTTSPFSIDIKAAQTADYDFVLAAAGVA